MLLMNGIKGENSVNIEAFDRWRERHYFSFVYKNSKCCFFNLLKLSTMCWFSCV